jgi:pimeloyl-ACP methyl ester carboxylesterase
MSPVAGRGPALAGGLVTCLSCRMRALLHVIHVGPPYVLAGHSYGGMITREFAALYPGEVSGMVLLDASSEPEIAVYDRLHAGPWIDGTVQPAPNQRINIHATVGELKRAPRLGLMPLILITAGILQDWWLKIASRLLATAQVSHSIGYSSGTGTATNRGLARCRLLSLTQVPVRTRRRIHDPAANCGRVPGLSD